MGQWVKFKLIERPYYTKDGTLLDRPLYTDRYGIAELYGGGKVYPESANHWDKIIEWCEKDGVLLLKLDIPESEAEEIKTKDKALKYKASPKVMKDYNHKDFKPEILTDGEAQTMKEDVFGIIEVESGVTIP